MRIVLWIALGMAAALAGCSRPDEGAGAKAVEGPRNAVDAVRQATQDAADRAGENTRAAMEKATGEAEAGADRGQEAAGK